MTIIFSCYNINFFSKIINTRIYHCVMTAKSRNDESRTEISDLDLVLIHRIDNNYILKKSHATMRSIK